MNERIKKLAEQAEQYTNDTVDERVHNKDFTFGDIDEVYNTKFAELIVRECMKEAWDEIIPDEDIAQEKDPLIREYLKGSNQGIVDAVIRFRNHFGVEE